MRLGGCPARKSKAFRVKFDRVDRRDPIGRARHRIAARSKVRQGQSRLAMGIGEAENIVRRGQFARIGARGLRHR